jgi:hypothetical protein
MKRIIYILLVFIGSFVNAQGYDFQELCLNCADQNGYYCGDDPANWTQYAPLGCVQTSWLNDGWEDCVDAGDENGAVPTLPINCQPPIEPCDTVYVDVPVFITDTLYIDNFIFDTIVQTEYITQIVIDTLEVEVFVPEYIYVTDTLWMEGALDTLFVDVIEYVEVTVFDTIIETEYVEFFVVEYIDCDTNEPCGNSQIIEIMKGSFGSDIMYNLNGQVIRKPEGIYIQNGEVKYKF